MEKRDIKNKNQCQIAKALLKYIKQRSPDNKYSFFYLAQLTEIRKVSLGKILCDNLDVTKMPENVFNTTSTW